MKNLFFLKNNLRNDIERIDEGYDSRMPFDPRDIKIKTTNLAIGTLIEQLIHNEIYYPSFHRRANLWNKTTQSRLIESILLRIPIPAFYFDGNDDGRWQVVDGIQRLSTIKNFIIDKFLILENLEYLKKYEGCSYGDLPRALQRRIKTYHITIHVIQKGTPVSVRFNIFKRLNTGGLPLTQQELRQALFQGIASEFIVELAQLEEFKSATSFSIKSTRMEDLEFVNRFVAFHLLGHSSKNSSISDLLNDGMLKIQELEKEELDSIKIAFIKAMQLAYSIFGDDAFRKRFEIDDRRKPINKALFDCISVSFAKLSVSSYSVLKERGNIFKEKLRKVMNTNKEFIRSITVNNSNAVEYRFSKIKTLIEETIGE